MVELRQLILVLGVSFLSACASMKPAAVINEGESLPASEPSLIQALPETIETFDYENYRYFAS